MKGPGPSTTIESGEFLSAGRDLPCYCCRLFKIRFSDEGLWELSVMMRKRRPAITAKPKVAPFLVREGLPTIHPELTKSLYSPV
jgi:hypothetical protein